MLASITPLGERGRHSRWGPVVAVFTLAATLAGAAVGALAGGVGRLAGGPWGAEATAWALAAVLAGALALDAGARRGRRVPGPRRQVDENWLTRYRGWVYGAGYGAQLGAGVVTIVPTAAVYVMLAAAVLSAEPASGALAVACFGAGRGLGLLVARRVRHPGALLALHRRLERGRAPVQRAVLSGEALMLATMLAAGALR
jgi:hypothetical protein